MRHGLFAAGGSGEERPGPEQDGKKEESHWRETPFWIL